MNRIAALACGMLLALGAALGPALASASSSGGPNDKKPVRKPVINLDNSAKQRRTGQVMPGDSAPATPATPTAPTPAPRPVETPAPKPAPPTPALTPTPQPQVQPPAPPAPAPPIPSAEPRKSVPPPPRLHASTAAVGSAAASAQVRPLGVVGAGANAPDAPWTELTSTWTGDTPIEVRVGVHAPVVIRIAPDRDPHDSASDPVPATLITLWPMARAMIGPEFVDGRWVTGVRLTRGQVTLQPETTPETSAGLASWIAAVRTPDRVLPIAGGGGKVAYDPVRRTRRWSLVSE